MKRSFAILLATALAANAPLAAFAQNHGGGGGGGSRPPQQSRPAPPPQSRPAQPPQSRPAQPPQQSRPAQPPSGARPPGFNLGDETRPPSRPPSGGNTAYKPPPSGGNNANRPPPNNGGNNGNYRPPNNGGNNGNYRPPNNGGNNGNYHRPPPPPPPGPYRPGYYGGRPIIVNPVYPPGPAWGWNRGVAWYPAPTYWGGGFWGALAIGVTSAAIGAAVYGSIVADNVTYTSYQVQPNSPGATLLINYQLTQTQCGPPNLVVIYGPNDSVICAYPNNLVSPGAYQLDPTQLSIVAIQ